MWPSKRAPSESFRWEGHTLEVYQAPAGAAASPGFRPFAEQVIAYFKQRLVFLFAGTFIVTLFSSMLYDTLLAMQIVYGAAFFVERFLLRGTRGYMYQLSWDVGGVTLRNRVGTKRVPLSELRSVVWEPLHWYGVLTRQPWSLGAQVRLQLLDGSALLVANATDPQVARALAEKLSADLKLEMVEQLAERRLVRSHKDLNKPVTGQLHLLKRNWLRLPSYGSWRRQETVDGFELQIEGSHWTKEAFFAVLGHSGSWLVAVLGFELLRLPAIIWATLLSVVNPSLHPKGFFDVDAGDVVSLALACVPIVLEIIRTGKRRTLKLQRGMLSYEVNGKLLGSMPVSRLEQVRYESFPSPGVRLVSDELELLVHDLPLKLDYEILTDQLPHLLPGLTSAGPDGREEPAEQDAS